MHVPELWGFVQFSDIIVGKGEESFVENPDEKIKWKLRELYYKQKLFFERNGKYAGNLKKLGILNQIEEGFGTSLQIEITQNLYEIIMPATKEGETIHIRQDGLVWKE